MKIVEYDSSDEESCENGAQEELEVSFDGKSDEGTKMVHSIQGEHPWQRQVPHTNGNWACYVSIPGIPYFTSG